MQIKIKRQKVSRCFKSHYFADLHGIPTPKEFLNWENQFSYSKSLFLDSTIPENLLISQNIWKFCKWKAKTTSKTYQLIIIYTEVDI